MAAPKPALAPLLVLAFTSLSWPLSAQNTAPKVDCKDPTSVIEINQCAALDLQKADKALNEAHRVALARIAKTTAMDPNVRREWQRIFRDAQQKWIAFRDADCNGAVAYEWFGSTGVTAAILGCMTEKTLARTKELRERNER